MVRIWLIRHGESESNAGLTTDGPESIPLTVLGRRQAEQIARVFAEAPRLIVTSRYLRAQQTAQPTISRFPAARRRQWPVQEFTYLGDLHGRATTPQERGPHVRAYWSHADPHHSDGGAESFADLLNRVDGFLKRLVEEESGPVAVFTHGLFMRAVVWSLLTGTKTPGREEMRGFRAFADGYVVPNGGIVELRNMGHNVPALQGATTLHLPAMLAG